MTVRRGDTIVEVLITIAVVAAVLVGAFWSSNRSTRSVRDSEEHAQALQYLQGQVETLRSKVLAGGFDRNSDNFCFDDSGSQLTAGDNACKREDGRYELSIKKVDVGGTPPLKYEFTSQWDSILGNKGNIQLYYKI